MSFWFFIFFIFFKNSPLDYLEKKWVSPSQLLGGRARPAPQSLRLWYQQFFELQFGFQLNNEASNIILYREPMQVLATGTLCLILFSHIQTCYLIAKVSQCVHTCIHTYITHTHARINTYTHTCMQPRTYQVTYSLNFLLCVLYLWYFHADVSQGERRSKKGGKWK